LHITHWSKVSAAAPKSPGNSSRRAILEQELANERRALSDAQTAMTDADTARSKGDWSGYGDAQKRLNDAVNRAIAAQQKLG